MPLGAWGILAGLWFATLTAFRRDPVWELLLSGMMFLLAAASVVRRGPVRSPRLVFCIALPAGLALAQLIFGKTISPTATALDVVRWLALTAWCLAVQRELSGTRGRFLELAVHSAGAFAVLSLAIAGTSEGRVLGPWVNPNHFAVWCELMLPPAVWLAVEQPRFWWAAGALAAGGAASGSRAGFALVALELCLLLALLGRRKMKLTLALGLLVLPLAAMLFRGDELWRKLHDSEPLLYRDQMWRSSLVLWKAAPWFGQGAGSFELAYPAAATFDTGELVDHAHNDWLEWGVEGGLALVIPLLAGYLYSIRLVPSLPWLLGVPIAGLHALVDYPWARFPMGLWVVLLITLASLPHPRSTLKQLTVRKRTERRSTPKIGSDGPHGIQGKRINLR